MMLLQITLGLIKIKFVCPLPTDPKISSCLKKCIGKNVFFVFFFVMTVHRITFRLFLYANKAMPNRN